MTESMKEVMNRWNRAKENSVQNKSHSKDHDDSLFRERDVVLPKQVDLALNVFKLLYGGHSLPLGSV